MFRLAHVTDPHFRGFSGVGVGGLVGKRAVGTLNLVVNRTRKHKMALLEALGADLRAQTVDHVALTGDLSNIAIDGEWRAALRWVEATGAGPEAVTIIPGNHDAYVADVFTSRAFERTFAPYQTGDVAVEGVRTVDAAASAWDVYPFVRVRGDVALVSVSSCVPTGDLGAWGEIGAAQLARVEAVLTSPALAGKTRVVLIHHPPVLIKDGEHRNLKDRAALAAMLARTGAELVLHGHDHADERATLAGPNGAKIPVVGAGSASYAGGPERRSRYNVYEIEGRAITCVVRAHDEATDQFKEFSREALA
ncbi:MAG TPA: metallophosphoesterase [Polyangia bacterium]|nr:metallophosphoesterase [Polyangia bacterium]